LETGGGMETTLLLRHLVRSSMSYPGETVSAATSARSGNSDDGSQDPSAVDSITIGPGSLLGRYEVTARIGRGGMGEVYRARDTRLKRDVAIKVLRRDLADDPERRRRFEVEAQATASLAHPNIVSVFDFGNQDGTIFLVTEFVFGETLGKHLGRRRLPMKTAVDWAGQLAAGLAAAHEKGIVHRDLKPDNILVTPDNRLRILDFGIAKLTNAFLRQAADLPSVEETLDGVVLGTARYMAPEQLRGSIAQTPSDVFSLGLVLHELITGKPLFCQPDVIEVVGALASYRKYEPPNAKHPDARRFVRLITRCLAKQPSSRPTAAQVEAELRRLSLGSRTVTARGPTRVAAARRVVPDEARQAWSKARFLLDGQLENWCEESFAALQKALDLAPAFAPARIDLSRWYVWAAVRGEIPYTTGLLQAVREAEHAVTLEPASTEALGALARAYYVGRRYQEAEAIFKQVIAKPAVNASTLCSYSELLSLVGRHSEALALVNQAIDDDPLNATVHCRKAGALFCARCFEECVDYCKHALQLSPTPMELHYFAGTALLMLDKCDEAVGYLSRAIELEPNAPVPKAAMVVAWHRLGRGSESARLLSELEEQNVDPAVRAEAYAGVGRPDEALACLEQGYRRDSPHVMGIGVNALLDPVRGHPRLRRLAQALGLPPATSP
jgi:tetratricopeptide (TPR) repeat protein/tRNA A-37 threonylcarbamoyl transferase component Bud32